MRGGYTAWVISPRCSIPEAARATLVSLSRGWSPRASDSCRSPPWWSTTATAVSGPSAALFFLFVLFLLVRFIFGRFSHWAVGVVLLNSLLFHPWFLLLAQLARDVA